MAYCIMRMEKKKSTRDVVMALDHNNRVRQPVNANSEKTPENWTFGGSTLESMNRFNERLPAKIRKNAVFAIEMIMTASPEFAGPWMTEKAKDGTKTVGYLNACDNWAKEFFGEKNLLHIAHHYDEKTPHSHILFQPLKDGKLNAKYFIGGSRDRMAEIQNDFFEKVGKRFGLERGKPKAETRAKHAHHLMADLEQREQAVAAAAQNLDSKSRMAAVVFKAMQEAQVKKTETEKFWPEFEQRLPSLVHQTMNDVRWQILEAEKFKKQDQQKTQSQGGVKR